ncbi:hypothetical protein [Hymenobacter cellulosilyticus]|uniref:Uncharacterized protein n=1 Tax=Hymenobacter cellulosilyticus TaxID=2932248 RepID=A0A8T9Q670_9BACT|nr:hypothetical protein [Hymenobacter cellulosilyticus]UOQ72605.1 hypothetical protein MUN79_00980 [Hymenobacter cellulosilyticus]
MYRILTRGRKHDDNRNTFVMAGFALLPFVAAPLESQLATPTTSAGSKTRL